MSAFPKPICAVCERPVDEFTVELYEIGAAAAAYNIANTGPVLVCVARCHGATEMRNVHAWKVVKAGALTPGRAFEKLTALGES